MIISRVEIYRKLPVHINLLHVTESDNFPMMIIAPRRLDATGIVMFPMRGQRWAWEKIVTL